MQAKKLKAYYLTREIVNFIEKFSKQINFDYSRLVEAMIDHFKNLPEAEQKTIIAKFMVKSLDKTST